MKPVNWQDSGMTDAWLDVTNAVDDNRTNALTDKERAAFSELFRVYIQATDQKITVFKPGKMTPIEAQALIVKVLRAWITFCNDYKKPAEIMRAAAKELGVTL